MDQFEIQTIDIEKTIASLIEGLKREKKANPVGSKAIKKLDSWIQQLELFHNQIVKIKNNVIPVIETDLGYPFSNIDHVIVAMTRPSFRNLFQEIQIHFFKDIDLEAQRENIVFLRSCPDIANTLAWIGDSAIKCAILKEIYKQGSSTEQLHNKRKTYEENKNLAKLCDKWKLFDFKIDLLLPNENVKNVNKTKGTLIEAIFGVIFIENGQGGILDAFPLIK